MSGLCALQRLAHALTPQSDRWASTMGEAEHPQAAVLVALTEELEPRVLLGRRAAHLSLHPGEVAFVGGKRETVDGSPWDTATREAMEEVGLPQQSLHSLGELPPLLTRTGFEVYPCMASVQAAPELEVDRGEFDSVFFVPLVRFSDEGLYRLEVMHDGECARKVPHYQLGEDSIWGVTAAILVLLVNVAYDAGLDLERRWKQTP
ncbi:MAG: CoA pyrophosphatase [Halioglobus sp.]|nr:CoA pyrophosphatase [Halioglobus sp.]